MASIITIQQNCIAFFFFLLRVWRDSTIPWATSWEAHLECERREMIKYAFKTSGTQTICIWLLATSLFCWWIRSCNTELTNYGNSGERTVCLHAQINIVIHHQFHFSMVQQWSVLSRKPVQCKWVHTYYLVISKPIRINKIIVNADWRVCSLLSVLLDVKL